MAIAEGALQAEVAAKLVEGTNPLDFIQQNLKRRREPVQMVEAPKEATPVVDPEPTFDPIDDNVALVMPDPREDGKIEIPFEDDTLEDSDPDVPPEAHVRETEGKLSPAEHIRDLRKLRRDLKNELKQKDTVLEGLQTEVESYKTGRAIPEVVEQLQTRVQELSYYEKLHALRLSPEYEENYLLPLEQIKQKAVNLAQEYGVDPRVFNGALETSNKRELNAYLNKHFDPVGALEAREIVEDLKNTQESARLAEQEPLEALNQLKEARNEAFKQEETARIGKITSNSRSGWIDALTDLRESGEYPELTLTGDLEQDRLVKPILEAAASEYGKMVSLLGGMGTKDMPKEAAKIMAKRFLLSQAASLMAKSRANHYAHAKELETNTARKNSMLRPAIGKSNGSGGYTPAPKAKSIDDAADMLLSRVLKK